MKKKARPQRQQQTGDKDSFSSTFEKINSLSLPAKLGALLVLAVFSYVLTQSVLFAFAAFAFIIALLASEFTPGTGLRQNAMEFAYALAFAIAAWFLLGFLLQTDSPINVVTSCSMRDTLERGDLIFIRGGVESAPLAKAPYGEMAGTQVHKALCVAGRNSLPCTDEIYIANQTVRENRNNDIIVFNPRPSGPGLLIHRVFAKVETEKGVFFLTKGDNNPVLDQESGRFDFVSENDVKGRVVLRIPYVGYLKLFLFLQFEAPPGCDTVLKKA